MKLDSLILFLVTAFVSISSHAAPTPKLPFSTEPEHPRRIEIGKKTLVTLKPGNFEIIIPSNPSPVTAFAAEELASALSGVFGTKIPVLKTPSGKKIEIRPGDQLLAKKLGIDISTFDRDGFVIRTAGKKILIIGRDNCKRAPRFHVKGYGDKGEWATLFGAYDFLERFAGVRYYYPTPLGTCTPRARELKIPRINIYDRPDFLQRRYSTGDVSTNTMILCKNWDRKLDQLRNRLESFYIPVLHGLAYLGYYHRFGKSHPEYFLLQSNGKRQIKLEFNRDNSQLCIASGIRREIVKDALSYFRQEPASRRGIRDWKGRIRWNTGRHPASAKVFDIMPNDSFNPCHCKECRKHFSGGPQASSNYIWSFFNDIARQVKGSGEPGCLGTMAYANYKLPPEMSIEKNLLVMLALTGPWSEFMPQKRENDMKLLKAWHEKLGQKTWLYTYAINEKLPGVPHTTPRALGAFVKRSKPYIFGFYHSNYGKRIFYNYLTNYIYGKLSWNNDLDVEQLLDEHARTLYGPAAKPVKEFFDTVEKLWGQITRNVEETPLGPVFMFPTEAALWKNIYTPEVRKRLSALFDEAERLAARDKLALERVRFLKQEMFQPLLNEAQRFEEINQAASAWRFHISEKKKALTIDGKLDDPAWKDARTFVLHGMNGAPADVRTAVKVLYDRDNLYFGFECEEPHTAQMEHIRRPKDGPVWKDCTAEVFLSPDGARNHYYQILINPNGSICDLEVFRDPLKKNPANNLKWNSNAEFRCRIVPGKKWIAEIRLPRSSMRPIAEKGLLANFTRQRFWREKTRLTAFQVWSPYVRFFGEVTSFGMLKLSPETTKNLIDDPDFCKGKLSGRRFGNWQSTTPIKKDDLYFVTGGSSIRQERGKKSCQLFQYLPRLKPDTTYEISFFVRMKNVEHNGKNVPWRVRFDTGGNSKKTFFPDPRNALFGTFPWRQCKFRTKTGDAPGSKNKPYINFVLTPGKGTVWIDHVQIREIIDK